MSERKEELPREAFDDATTNALNYWGRLITRLLSRRVLCLVTMGLIIILTLFVQPFEELSPKGLGLEGVYDPISVAAIPNLGENQQVLITEWPGRSPKEVEDHITYPLMAQLRGLSGVKTTRGSSLFGLSSIYVIFDENKSEEWARARLLETLASLPDSALPFGIKPQLGPDATALGQVFWYVLEPQEIKTGSPSNDWDLEALRSIQDWQIKRALEAVEGVAEVSSVGGYVKEYVVEADPKLLSEHGLSLNELSQAVRESNLDVGARSLEINQVEHLVRGVGQLSSMKDLEQAVIPGSKVRGITIGEVASVYEAPGLRRGALDIGGAETVGGIVVIRSSARALEVIKRIKAKIASLNDSLPTKQSLEGERSQVRIKPIYDRSILIGETLSTLSSALTQQILITLIVVLALLGSLSSALVISMVLPLGLSLTFLLMWGFDIQANMMSLSGIAIAIGTMVDMGVIIVERIERGEQDHALSEISRVQRIAKAVSEVAPAVFTSTCTTLFSFLPVLALTEAEGKLFYPLAVTKSLALLSAFILAILTLPILASFLMRSKRGRKAHKNILSRLSLRILPLLLSIYLLSFTWTPLGHDPADLMAFIDLFFIIFACLSPLWLFIYAYRSILSFVLDRPLRALLIPFSLILFGGLCWLGVDRDRSERMNELFPGLGSEFMPPFDEGEFVYMPTLMPHVAFTEALEVLRRLDADLENIPEISQAVGKLGRAESALDPAPVSMFEILISYRAEYEISSSGQRLRRWRSHIRSPHDIWLEVQKVAMRPGLTSAPLLMPIQTRQVMLQSGMRAPQGLKIQAESLLELERAGRYLEAMIRTVPGISAMSVFAERVVGKPYLEVHFDRAALKRYGLTMNEVQRSLSITLAGEVASVMILGRERYAIRVRGSRAYRDEIEGLRSIPIVINSQGDTAPLDQLAEIVYVHGPQMIKSEDGVLSAYLTFGLDDTKSQEGASDLMERVLLRISQERQKLKEQAIVGPAGELIDPLNGVLVTPEGHYKSQERSSATLRVLIPIALLLILSVLSLQFRRKSTIAMIYAGVLVSLSGAFILLWCYQQTWFLNFDLFGVNPRDLLHIEPVKLSVAVWVGMIALLGIATDDGVVIASALEGRLNSRVQLGTDELRSMVIEESCARLIPCLMTTATTLIALLPVITSSGRGADVMRPMALPSIGGMCLELLTLFVVPTLFYWREHRRIVKGQAHH